jgi:hypothetical protein
MRAIGSSVVIVSMLMSFQLMAQLTVTLTPSSFNGYNISCFGKRDGQIQAAVSGGTAPYTYSWSNGASTATITNLSSGYHRLSVRDANNLSGTAEITLTQPEAINYRLTPSEYPNGFNISCNECYNGSILQIVSGGVAPFSFLWSDGATSQNRTGLGSLTYSVEITDANGCEVTSNSVFLTQPERDGWYRGGNTGTNAAQHYIGTADSVDMVLKTDGQEVLRLGKDGKVYLKGANDGTGIVYRDEDGSLRAGGFPGDYPVAPEILCKGLGWWAFWRTNGNNFTQLCPDESPILGTLDPRSLEFVTHGQGRMIIDQDGRVGIGTVSMPSGPIGDYRLYVEDGIVTREVLVKTGEWPDYVFANGYRLMPLEELRDFLKRNRHLPGIPSAVDIKKSGGVAVGDLQPRLLKVIEEQALYILQLEEKFEALEQRLRVLETSN